MPWLVVSEVLVHGCLASLFSGLQQAHTSRQGNKSGRNCSLHGDRKARSGETRTREQRTGDKIQSVVRPPWPTSFHHTLVSIPITPSKEKSINNQSTSEAGASMIQSLFKSLSAGSQALSTSPLRDTLDPNHKKCPTHLVDIFTFLISVIMPTTPLEGKTC